MSGQVVREDPQVESYLDARAIEVLHFIQQMNTKKSSPGVRSAFPRPSRLDFEVARRASRVLSSLLTL